MLFYSSLKNKLLFMFALILFFLIQGNKPSYAARFTGEYLLRVCALDKNNNEQVDGGKVICQSYISGVIDYHNTLRAMDLTSEMNFCIPQDATLNDIQIRVFAYLYRYKKLHRNFVAAPAVSMALFSFYPCKN